MVSSIIFMVSGEETRGKIANAVSTPMEAIQDKVAEAAAIMPSAATATNSVTAGINNIIKNVTTPNGSAQPQAQTNVRRNNTVKSPNIPGAGFSASGL
jgi:translation initiation factor 2 gamma subunit (eIF-2gamma)